MRNAPLSIEVGSNLSAVILHGLNICAFSLGGHLADQLAQRYHVGRDTLGKSERSVPCAISRNLAKGPDKIQKMCPGS